MFTGFSSPSAGRPLDRGPVHASMVEPAVSRSRSVRTPVITLALKEQPTVPLEAESLSPDVMATLGHDAIRGLPVLLGKRQHRLEGDRQCREAETRDYQRGQKPQ